MCIREARIRGMSLRVKDSGLRLRVERDLREDFVTACRGAGRTAAEVLREYMRAYVERSRTGQKDLFTEERTAEPSAGSRNKIPRAHARQRRYRGLQKSS